VAEKEKENDFFSEIEEVTHIILLFPWVVVVVKSLFFPFFLA
jgi:hypothetical protein